MVVVVLLTFSLDLSLSSSNSFPMPSRKLIRRAVLKDIFFIDILFYTGHPSCQLHNAFHCFDVSTIRFPFSIHLYLIIYTKQKTTQRIMMKRWLILRWNAQYRTITIHSINETSCITRCCCIFKISPIFLHFRTTITF